MRLAEIPTGHLYCHVRGRSRLLGARILSDQDRQPRHFAHWRAVAQGRVEQLDELGHGGLCDRHVPPHVQVVRAHGRGVDAVPLACLGRVVKHVVHERVGLRGDGHLP